MNILVIGAGEVGFHLAKYLNKEDHRVTLVDVDKVALGRAMRVLDVQTICGNGSDASVLMNAGAASADLVVAVTGFDELNMLASMVAKKIGAGRSIVRIHAEQGILDRQYFYKDTLGFDLTISPDEMAGLEILRICRGQNSVPVENFAGGKLQMRRLEILEDSPAAGKRLADIKLPARALVTGVARSAEVVVPRGEFVLESGDFAMLIGTPEALDRAEKVLGGRRDLPKRVMIVGGGPIAVMVTRDLTSIGISVRLIEKDPKIAQRLSEELQGAEVVCGVGTDLDVLGEEGIATTDVFVSLVQRDEVNLLGCQLARTLGAKTTVAMVNKPDYASLVAKLGIDYSVSPRRLVAKRIAHYVRGGTRGSIARIYRGAAEVVDLVVPDSWTSASVREIRFPAGSIVAGIIRGEEIIVPGGDTRVEPGDHLIVFAVIKVLAELESVFETTSGVQGAPDA